MTEYVIDATDALLGDEFDARALYGPRLKEEVVRCGDCAYYVEDPEPIDPGWPMMCEESGRDMLGPNGFCNFGVRRSQ